MELILVAVWGWWTWRDPRRALAVFPFLLPTYVLRTTIGPFPTTALELLLIATLIGWYLRRGQAGLKDAWLAGEPWRIPVALWLLAGLLGVFVSPVKLQALGLFRAYFIEPLLLFFIGLDLIQLKLEKRNAEVESRPAVNLPSSNLQSSLTRSFALITVILGAWSVVQFLTGWGIPNPWDVWPGRRATGPYPFPNALALFVAPLVALAGAERIADLAARRAAPSQVRMLGWLAVAFGLTAVLLAQSDGGLLAIAVSILVALCMHRRTRRAAIGLAIAGLTLVYLIQPLRTHIEDKLFFKEWSGQVRTVIWQETVAMLRDTSTKLGLARPLLGAGLAAYRTAILPYHQATWMEVFQYPHNILLNLWSETGLLGLVAFAWILIVWIKTGRLRSDRTGSCDVIIPVIAAILVHGLVDVPYFKNDLAVAFWLLILTTSLPPYLKTPFQTHRFSGS